MDKNGFRIVLRKYLRGEASSEEEKLIDEWYSAMEDEGQGVGNESDPDQYGWREIHAHIQKSKKRKNIRSLMPWYAAGLAASVVILIAFSVLFRQDEVRPVPVRTLADMPGVIQDVVNTNNQTQILTLPDSSRVSLEPDARLKVSETFNKTDREVFLEGEAFFDVTHNKRIPFTVHANEVTTKVLGTTFIIKALKNDNKITVAVKTGKVSVFTQPVGTKKTADVKEIILTPNQQIVYDKNEKELSRTLVNAPQAILPEEEIKRMRFEEAPVAEIFHALEKTFGVDIEFDKEVFSSCRLTTVISKDDLYGRLNIICNVIGTSYTMQEGRIVIASAGCKGQVHQEN